MTIDHEAWSMEPCSGRSHDSGVCLQDDGADIDTSALLLPEPGVADDTAPSAAAGADDPDEAFADQLAEAGRVSSGLMTEQLLCIAPTFIQESSA